MTIDTNTIVSNSNLFQKKIKDAQNVSKSEKIGSDNVTSADRRVISDFADVTQTDNSFKRRIMENNARLTAYEDDYNRLEFLQQQIEMIENLDIAKERADINAVIEDSVYGGKNIFAKYGEGADEIVSSLSEIKRSVAVEQAALEQDFKAIEIANQNILSLNTVISDKSVSQIAKLDIQALNEAIHLSNRRVIDLIS
ncbi:MAG: hypothetical protein II707_03950 [Spirochaetales bacterium]|nr:hypothetical protein [Spirochaetales bacterium]